MGTMLKPHLGKQFLCALQARRFGSVKGQHGGFYVFSKRHGGHHVVELKYKAHVSSPKEMGLAYLRKVLAAEKHST